MRVILTFLVNQFDLRDATVNVDLVRDLRVQNGIERAELTNSGYDDCKRVWCTVDVDHKDTILDWLAARGHKNVVCS